VNARGYYIDNEGNIVDYMGKLVFRQAILDEVNGEKVEIPKVFRSNKYIKAYIST
jgi:hypothetical protein